MKSVITLFAFVITAMSSYAQFSSSNSIIRKALVAYELGDDGYYHRVTNKMVDYVSGIESNYAYDKDAQNLYVIIKNSNTVITLTKEYSKIFKKNNTIPQLKDEELDAVVSKFSKQLDDKYAALNEARTKRMQDSIAKAKADAAEAERQRALQLTELKKQREDYMKEHHWRWTPTGNISLYCTVCEKSFSEDSLLTVGVKNDSIYYFTLINGSLGIDLSRRA